MSRVRLSYTPTDASEEPLNATPCYALPGAAADASGRGGMIVRYRLNRGGDRRVNRPFVATGARRAQCTVPRDGLWRKGVCLAFTAAAQKVIRPADCPIR